MTTPFDVKKILVPVDFSDGSRRALETALDFAEAFGASVDLLHVWEPPGYIPIDTAFATIGTGPPETLGAIARRAATKDMEGLIAGLKKPAGASVASRVESGDACDTILRTAADGAYDLIVMGTHGRTGLGHFVMGSVAERVVRRSPCPVLTVKAPPKKGE